MNKRICFAIPLLFLSLAAFAQMRDIGGSVGVKVPMSRCPGQDVVVAFRF